MVEFTWLDRSGISQPQNYQRSRENGLYDKIQQQLAASGAGREKLHTGVLDHLRAGIQVENVLISHFTICGHLGITEATPYILDAAQ